MPAKIHITIRKPDSHDPGEVEFGHYVEQDGKVQLTDELGEPIGDAHMLRPEDDPATIARALLRERSLSRRGNGFRGPLRYPRLNIV